MTYRQILSSHKSKHWKTRMLNARHAAYVRGARKAWRTKRANGH